VQGTQGVFGTQGIQGIQGFFGQTGPTVYPSAGIAVSSGSAWLASKTSPTGDIVGTTDTQLLSNKTITGEREVRVAGGTGGSYTINLQSGNYFTRTFNQNATISVSNVPASGTAQAFIFDITNAGSYTITWMTGVRWPSGIAPSLTASGRDILGFFTHDGGANWNGIIIGKDVK
jgi:hypothetical protein